MELTHVQAKERFARDEASYDQIEKYFEVGHPSNHE